MMQSASDHCGVIRDDSSYFKLSLNFLRRFRHIFDFKMTHFFIDKPYEKVPSSWLTFLNEELVHAVDRGEHHDHAYNSYEQLDRSNSIEGKTLIEQLFLKTSNMPDGLREYISSAFDLTLMRHPFSRGKRIVREDSFIAPVYTFLYSN